MPQRYLLNIGTGLQEIKIRKFVLRAVDDEQTTRQSQKGEVIMTAIKFYHTIYMFHIERNQMIMRNINNFKTILFEIRKRNLIETVVFQIEFIQIY